MPGRMERQIPEPMQWQVNGLQLAGLGWGRPGEKPLLALHGWLDNAASFTRLAPCMEGYHVVAPDLTGHGQSARRSADASYQIWDDLPELLGIVNELGWDTFDLVGHSRGGIISTLLASAFPERVSHLVLLDAVSPGPVPPEDFPVQMRKALLDKPALLRQENRVFKSIDQAVASRARRGLSESAARLLVERSITACAGGFTWTTDPRLQGASAVKLTDAQIRAVLGALSMPTLFLMATQNPNQMPDMGEYARSRIDGVKIGVVEGEHHFHMESTAPETALHLAQFLSGVHEQESA